MTLSFPPELVPTPISKLRAGQPAMWQWPFATLPQTLKLCRVREKHYYWAFRHKGKTHHYLCSKAGLAYFYIEVLRWKKANDVI